MDWEKKFNLDSLKRGRELFFDCSIDKFQVSDRFCSGLVHDGGDVVRVTVFHPNKKNMLINCSCRKGIKGKPCRHAAALLYEWQHYYSEEENENENEATGNRQIAFGKELVSVPIEEPFPRAPKGQEPFYHLADITSDCRITDRVNREARKLLASGSVVMTGFKIRYGSLYYQILKSQAEAVVKGESSESTDRPAIEAVFTEDRIVSCSCKVCKSTYQGTYYFRAPDLCPHLTALLMLADDYTKQIDPGDYTDLDGTLFLNAYGRRLDQEAASDEIEAAGNVRLAPRIVDEGYGYELQFRIGNGGRMYIVKSISELVRKVRDGERMTFGKSCTIDFNRETFTKESEYLYQLAEREIKRGRVIEQKLRARNYYGYVNVNEGRGIPFSGDVIDTVYDRMIGQSVDFKGLDADAPDKLLVGGGKLSCDVTVKPSMSKEPGKVQLKGLRVEGELPEFLEGQKAKYYISEGRLGRLEEETWGKLMPFAAAVNSSDNTFSFLIGDKTATEFYYRILPELQQDPTFHVRVTPGIQSMIAPEAEFAFYLDAENDQIRCHAEARYGDKPVRLWPFDRPARFQTRVRDIYHENRVRDELDEMFEDYDLDHDEYITADTDDNRFDMLKNGVDRLLELGEVHSTEAFSRLKIRRTPILQLGVSVESDLMDLEIKTQDMGPEELRALLESYQQRKKYHRLHSGEFVELEQQESLDMLFRLFETMGVPLKEFVDGKMQVPTYRALYLDTMLEGHDELVAGRDRAFRNIIKNFKTINEADYEVPSSLAGVLRPYQANGFKWLKTLETAGFGGILADDMGLGKTLQFITLILSAKEEGNTPCALVVCPASLVYNWIEEIGRFAPGLKAVAVAGTKQARRDILREYASYDFLVTSYDLLKRDVDLYEDCKFTHQVLDEAQYVKNAKSVAAKSVKVIRAEHRFAMTGTPIENRLSELWSIFDYLMPGFLYDYNTFRSVFELPISKGTDEQKTETLRNMISPFLLRRRKDDVLRDLPEKLEEIRYAVFEKKQRQLYDGQVVKIRNMTSDSEDIGKDRIKILAELTRIRQICCDPHLLFADYKGQSAKREACLDLIRSAVDGGHKILVFSQFTSMLSLLEEDLAEEEIAFYKIIGDTPKEERVRLVREFNKGDTPVFLISLKAGGTGLNLTGADIVIHYDPWWNLAAQEQATDRAHRIGQTRKVTVFKLIAKDSIEEKIVKLQESKKELADAVLSGETRSLGTMSKEELLALLS